MSNTPEIQARIERLNEKKAKEIARMIFKIGDGPAPCTRIAFMSGKYATQERNQGGVIETALALRIKEVLDQEQAQVPAEAKDEDLEAVAKEAKAYAFAWCDNATKDADRLRYAYCAGFFKARSTQPKSGSDIAEQPAPGLDYERLFEVLTCDYYAMSPDGVVFSYEECPQKRSDGWYGMTWNYIARVKIRNLPADWTQSLRVREPKPEPDVEPDENTPRLTEVEFQRIGHHGAWETGHFLEIREINKLTSSFMVLADDNCVLGVPRCRLRREGK